MTKVLVYLLFLCAASQSNAQSENVEKDVYVLLEQYAKALNEKDVKKAASFMSSDPFFKHISAGFITTKDEWIDIKSASWARMSNYSFRWIEKDIKALSASSAVATCNSSFTFRIKGGPWGPGTSIYTMTFEMVDKQWLITSIHESKTKNTNYYFY